jgi:hypothetical protein
MMTDWMYNRAKERNDDSFALRADHIVCCMGEQRLCAPDQISKYIVHFLLCFDLMPFILSIT